MTIEIARIDVGEITLNTALAGSGPPIVLLHGWPHTWRLWGGVIEILAESRRVIAPDLRGTGGSTRAATGYDLQTVADDIDRLLDVLDVSDALVAGIDVGAPIAWMFAERHPARARRLAVMEAVLPNAPGAEEFFADGPPWWFGFHAVEGLAEAIVAGREDHYLGWFLDGGTVTALAPGLREEFVAAYSGYDSLRCGFEYYRRNALNSSQIQSAVADARRVPVPTLAIAGGVVGHVLGVQLQPITQNLRTVDMTHCGHLIPVDDPCGLAVALAEFADPGSADPQQYS